MWPELRAFWWRFSEESGKQPGRPQLPETIRSAFLAFIRPSKPRRGNKYIIIRCQMLVSTIDTVGCPWLNLGLMMEKNMRADIKEREKGISIHRKTEKPRTKKD
jgi:hypothetical protein